MTRATLDSNIFISALAFGGEPKRILEMAKDGQIEIAVSEPILNEVSRILAGEKFGWPPERIQQARRVIRDIAQYATSTQKLDVVKADPSDKIVLECAAESLSDVIITGDKHLLRLKSYAGTPILKVGEFLASGKER